MDEWIVDTWYFILDMIYGSIFAWYQKIKYTVQSTFYLHCLIREQCHSPLVQKNLLIWFVVKATPTLSYL